MEGSEREAVFDSLNLNPQLFVNETINTVDDLVDEAFDFYRREATALLKIEGSDRSKDLSDGIDSVHGMIQSIVEKRLQMWEHYCLQHCFSVPEGFSLPETNESAGFEHTSQEALFDPDLDAQLDSLREKLNLVGKKSAELNSELQALERMSASSNASAGLVSEVLQLHDQASVCDILKEMANTASELRRRMGKLKTRRTECIEHVKTQRINNLETEFSPKAGGLGFSDVNLENLEEFLAELRKM